MFRKADVRFPAEGGIELSAWLFIPARKLGTGTQRGHIRSCKQFAPFLKRSPDTVSADESVGSSCFFPEPNSRNCVWTALGRIAFAGVGDTPAIDPQIFEGSNNALVTRTGAGQRLATIRRSEANPTGGLHAQRSRDWQRQDRYSSFSCECSRSGAYRPAQAYKRNKVA